MTSEYMTFAEALEAMKLGLKVRLPEWGGYWKIVEDSFDRPNILVFTKEGEILTTPHTHYMFREDWVIVAN